MIETAVIDALSNPIIEMVDNLLMYVDIDDKSMEEMRKKYISEAIKLSRDERKAGADKLKNEILEAIYGKEREKEMRSVVARLCLGGEVASAELTDEQRIYVASLIMKTYKEKYEDLHKFPFIATRP